MGEHQVVRLRRAVFLDRDGVLNRAPVRDGKPVSPRTVAEFELLPGVGEACRLLNAAGFLLVVVTNQPDVGRGKMSREVLDRMHVRLQEEVPLDGIEVCYDADDQSSEFRKPLPGMIFRAAHKFGIDLARSYLIGDRWRDIDCGRAAGCTTFFIDYGYAEQLRQLPDHWVNNLREAVNIILAGPVKSD